MNDGPMSSFQPSQTPQQGAVLVPQGLIGDIIGRLAPLVGGAVGGTAGNVINTAGQFASLLPFSAGPQTTQQGQHRKRVVEGQGLIGDSIGRLTTTGARTGGRPAAQ